mmetsp:Transcript_41379/g.88180  ORF Transcript_41379/g.88180 Transcript_41379/m.88180 type:complete len:210 (+) Transcript_41379:284-913(+)
MWFYGAQGIQVDDSLLHLVVYYLIESLAQIRQFGHGRDIGDLDPLRGCRLGRWNARLRSVGFFIGSVGLPATPAVSSTSTRESAATPPPLVCVTDIFFLLRRDPFTESVETVSRSHLTPFSSVAVTSLIFHGRFGKRTCPRHFICVSASNFYLTLSSAIAIPSLIFDGWFGRSLCNRLSRSALVLKHFSKVTDPVEITIVLPLLVRCSE